MESPQDDLNNVALQKDRDVQISCVGEICEADSQRRMELGNPKLYELSGQIAGSGEPRYDRSSATAANSFRVNSTDLPFLIEDPHPEPVCFSDAVDIAQGLQSYVLNGPIASGTSSLLCVESVLHCMMPQHEPHKACPMSIRSITRIT